MLRGQSTSSLLGQAIWDKLASESPARGVIRGAAAFDSGIGAGRVTARRSARPDGDGGQRDPARSKSGQPPQGQHRRGPQRAVWPHLRPGRRSPPAAVRGEHSRVPPCTPPAAWGEGVAEIRHAYLTGSLKECL